jgi:hypothetical protein
MVTDTGYALAALISLFSLLLSARALLVPRAAAIGFGIPAVQGLRPYMAIKASRDLAVGLVIVALLTTAAGHTIGWVVLAATAIPVADGIIVLRAGGPGRSPSECTTPPRSSCWRQPACCSLPEGRPAGRLIATRTRTRTRRRRRIGCRSI